MRREKGTGMISKLSGKRHKPYVARVPFGRDKNGRILYKTIGCFKTRSEAAMALAHNLVNPTPTKEKITLKELYNEFKVIHYRGKSDNLVESYTTAWKHLAPLYDWEFNQLRTAHYQHIIDSMKAKTINKPKAKTGARKIKLEQKELSTSSKQKVKVLVGLLYKYAMQNDICNKNYAQFIVIPKDDKKPIEIFSEIDIKKLKNNDTIYGVDMILMLISTGFRIQEAVRFNHFRCGHQKQNYCRWNKN